MSYTLYIVTFASVECDFGEKVGARVASSAKVCYYYFYYELSSSYHAEIDQDCTDSPVGLKDVAAAVEQPTATASSIRASMMFDRIDIGRLSGSSTAPGDDDRNIKLCNLCWRSALAVKG